MGEIVTYEEQVSYGQFLLHFSEVTEADRSLVGGKGYSLAKMYQAGLPVPEGVIIIKDAHTAFELSGEIPDGLVDEVKQVKGLLGGEVALRSSATVEDGDEQSMAGVFISDYVIHDEDVAPSLQRIYEQVSSDDVQQYLSRNNNTEAIEMAVVEQELVRPDYSGVIYTGVNGTKLLVQYIDGFGTALVDGEGHGSAILVEEETGVIEESSDFEERPLNEAMVEQIITSAKQAVELFNGANQDIEFAISGGKLFILQSRTLTTELTGVTLGETAEEILAAVQEKLHRIVEEEKVELATGTVVLSDSNFSELLPRPKEMDLGIFTYIFTGSDGVPGGIQLGRKEMGYQFDNKTVGYTHFIGGRPYFSLAKDALTYYSGFPDTQQEYTETLVGEYLTAATLNPEKGKYPEMGLYIQDPSFDDLKIRFGGMAESYYNRYQHFKEDMGEYAATFLDQFQQVELPAIEKFIGERGKVDVDSLDEDELIAYTMDILEHLRTVSCVDFVKAARLGFYYSQRMMLDLQEKLGMEKEEVEQAFSRLSQGLDISTINDVNIALEAAPTKEEAYQLAQELVGHFSTSEMLEVRHTRLKDDPDALRAYVDGIRQSGTYAQDIKRQREERLRSEAELLAKASPEDREEMGRTIHAAQTYMSLRETVKYHFVREYALMHDALEALNSRLGLGEGDVYSVYPRELIKLRNNPGRMKHLLDSRKRAFDNYNLLEMPPVIREGDIDSLALSSEHQEEFTELRGKFLALGEAVTGIVINIDEFTEKEDLEQALQRVIGRDLQVILAATQMNLGHDPYIAAAAGLVIKNAGITCHGAQRARELGRGAIGGINTRFLKTGMEIYFDPQERVVRKVVPQSEGEEEILA